VTILPALPILTPLAGALICAIPRYPIAGRLARRGVYAVVLVLTAISLAMVWAGGDAVVASAGPQSGYLAYLAMPLWSPLGYWAALLVLAVLMIGLLADLERPLAAARSVHYLIVVSATMATVSSGNSIGFVLAWSIPQWLILYLRVSQGESSGRTSRWDTWAGFGSVALVVLGATAATMEQGGSPYLVEIGPGLAFASLAIAAGLRLLSWPLIGGRGRWWQLHAMSLACGLYLWLRLGIALDSDGPLVSHPTATVALVLALGLLIGPREGQSRVVPYGFGYWLALALLAPLLDPESGFAVSLLIGTQLMLCLVILRGYLEPAAGTWFSRVSGLVAWASLSGILLTSGFAVYWTFGQICLTTGGVPLLMIASVSYLVAALPLWRRLTLPAEIYPDGAPARLTRPFGVALLAVSGVLVLLGVWPGVLEWLFPEIRVGLAIFGYARLWGEAAPDRVTLFLAIFLVPGIAGLVGRRAPQLLDAPHRWMRWIEQRVRGEWLYLIGQRALALVTGSVRTALESLEGSLSLGWCLLWAIALIYYLLRR
jgi:hypothetical protein